MYRFFVGKDQVQGKVITVEDGDAKHIKDVLRMKIGQELELLEDTRVYTCKIVELEKGKVLFEILKERPGDNEARLKINLFQGLPKSTKMDMILQKGTEIGIRSFTPVMMKRSVSKIENEKKEKSKMARWEEILEASAKQAKRDLIPKMEKVLYFKEMVNLLSEKKNILVAYEDEDMLHIGEAFKSLEGEEVNIVIGPEGGFEDEEIDGLKAIGANVVSLGSRILRTETAGLVAATICLYENGDI